jgi:SAM-dependent methyltransferase
MSHSVEALAAEEARIRSVYARRQTGDRYSWFQPSHLFTMHQCERRMLSLLHRCGLADLRAKTILEIGCGAGYWLREFTKWGAQPENITGIDLLSDRVATARRLCPPGVHVQCASAVWLPFRDEAFDLVFQSTVFTSILDSGMKQQIGSEMLRVLRNDGFILWYDYRVNNPWNSDVRGIRRREIYRLFPDCRIDLKRITLIPPLARVLCRYSYMACYVLEKLPPFCTHYLGVIQKR